MKNSVPIACTLPETALAARTHDITQNFLAHALSVTELVDGYQLQFPNENTWFQEVAEFVAAERQCCAFLRFEIEVPPQGQSDLSPLSLRLRGDDEAKTFLQGILQPTVEVTIQTPEPAERDTRFRQVQPTSEPEQLPVEGVSHG